MALDYSLNEVEATVKKAVRAVGYPWGLAEEAGRSARWLCHYGHDGCAAVIRHLSVFDGLIDSDNLDAHSPCTQTGIWRADVAPLCPFYSGVSLSDHAQPLVNELLPIQELQLEQVVEPLLLCFFVAQAARQCNSIIRLDWQGGSVVADAHKASVTDNSQSVLSDVTMSLVDTQIAHDTVSQRGYPGEKTWQVLNQYAARTYAPATEESRLKGAGAGLSDND